MKPKSIRINRVELRVRGGDASPARLAGRIGLQVASHTGGPAATLQRALSERIAGALANARRK